MEQPLCPNAARRCGGCPQLALPYAEQLARKQALAGRLLGPYGPVHEILPAPEPWHYRNKAIASFAPGPRGTLSLGIYAEGSHRVLPYEDCLLQAEILNRTVSAVQKAAAECRCRPFEEDRGTGDLRHLLVRCDREQRQVMAVLVTAAAALPGSRNLANAVRRAAPWVTTLVQNVNPRQTSAVLGGQEKTLFGPGHITDTLCGLRFSLSPRSFYQVNPAQTERLYALALQAAGLRGGETVIDAYCGIGTIGLCAAPHAGQVIGVERNPAAVTDAAANARRNGIANACFVCADATPWMQAAAQSVKPDVVFLDPPRQGSTPECVQAIAQMQPRRVVYISCSPDTLARDTALFVRAGYRAAGFWPVDMFPHTDHVETVVLLSKGEIDSKKVRVEFSLEDMDMSGFQKGATYEQIKAYVLEHTGLKVSSLYISQIKRKCGLDVGQNYNLSKKEDAKVPKCPPEKEAAIRDALKYFQMI